MTESNDSDVLAGAPDSLLAAALQNWQAQIAANREQSDRLGEAAAGEDFFAPVAERFRDDPRREGEAALEVLRSLAQPDDVWLDVGAGGGRYALPLALQVREVIALDPSEAMLQVLESSCAEHRIENVRTVRARWPMPDPPEADVVMICNVGYGVANILPFLDALEGSARRLCVALMRWRHPASNFNALWSEVYGEPRTSLPALREFVTLLAARDTPFDLRVLPAQTQRYWTVDEALSQARHHLRLASGSPREAQLRERLEARLQERDGRFSLHSKPAFMGVVTWAPRNRVSQRA